MRERDTHVVKVAAKQIRDSHPPTACVTIHELDESLKAFDPIKVAIEVGTKMRTDGDLAKIVVGLVRIHEAAEPEFNFHRFEVVESVRVWRTEDDGVESL